MHEKIVKIPDHYLQTTYQPYGFTNMDFRNQNSFSSEEPSHSPKIEKNKMASLNVSPILSGTGSVTHNVTRMLENSVQSPEKESANQRIQTSPVKQYSTVHFMSFRHNILQNYTKTYGTDLKQGYSESDNSTSDMSMSTSDISMSTSNISMSTEPSISPPSSVSPPPANVDISPSSSVPSDTDVLSSDDTPSSGESLITNSSEPDSCNSSRVSDDDCETTKKMPKKGARTNFTREQVNALMKIFHETPYPDADMMENIAKDLNLKERQVKIWFQNKRARWRRRVNDNKNNTFQSLLPTSPMMSPATSFGYLPTGHSMTSSPLGNYYGYTSYPWIQGYAGHNYSNQQFIRQNFTNPFPGKYQPINENIFVKNNTTSDLSTVPLGSTMSSVQYDKALKQQHSPDQSRRYLQYSNYMQASV